MNASSALRRIFFIAVAGFAAASPVAAFPGKVIIGNGATGPVELIDEGYLWVSDLQALNISGVSKAEIILKVTTDRGRVHQTQVLDGVACTVSYNANGYAQSVECDLTDIVPQ